MDSEDEYDEFGNFIGKYAEDEEDEGGEEIFQTEPVEEDLMEVDDETRVDAIVLHEDKQYYPSALQVYGQDVEALVEEEDTQPLSMPIIQPVVEKKFSIEEKGIPNTNFSRQFMIDLASYPEFIRNITFMGHLHSGKTSFIDMLVASTHINPPKKYTSIHNLEIDRKITIKSSPMSLVLQSSRGKSLLFNMMDTPGHADFSDEIATALRISDGAVLVIDVVEGMTTNTERMIKYAVQENIKLVLVVNKIDRLILELKLPPTDAYFKIKHAIEEVNAVLRSLGAEEAHRLSPEKGNVIFSSTEYGWCFDLKGFARIYSETYNDIDVIEFSKRLWGDIYYHPETNRFSRQSQPAKGRHTVRSFVHFVLEPLFKIHGQVVGEDSKTLNQTLKLLNIQLTAKQLKLDARPLLKIVCERFFGSLSAFVDVVSAHIPSAKANAPVKVARTYTGPQNSIAAQSMSNCDADGPLVIQISKMYASVDASEFNAFGRILSGTVLQGQKVQILGENYTIDDEEDQAPAVIEDVWIFESRYKIPTSGLPAGNWVLLSKISNTISKSATIVEQNMEEEAFVFKPIGHMTEAVIKIAVEPVNPSELPKMLEGLRRVSKSYPLLVTKVEESGEHIILGVGEMYMDCVLYDLRKLYTEIDLKVSDPVVRFCETCIETSALKCFAETPNNKNKITMLAEPLDDGLAEDIENGNVDLNAGNKIVRKFFEEKYEWDALAARSIWAFGPDNSGPNILVNDTIPDETNQKLLGSVRDSIRQGFQWGSREGPLCDDPIRNVKFRLLDATISDQAIYRGGGQIIPTARRICYSSFLMAAPRMMEPILVADIEGPADTVPAIHNVLSRRRGHAVQDTPKAGSPLYRVKAFIPAIDSFGFETDLRTHTQGMCSVSQIFDRWQLVPGNPLDKGIQLQPLEPAFGQNLARDFMLKTRRRKGLTEDVNIGLYLPEANLSDFFAANGIGSMN